MTRQQRIRQAFMAFAALAVLLVATGAEAQRRKMPVRTQEIPDTESGRPAASAANPTFKGRMIIFGPPSLPVTPPPEHLRPVPPEEAAVAKPAAAPAPAPVIAAPAPAPVVTPTAPVAPPVAVPIPAPAPPPVAAPAPAPAPAPVAAPAPVVKPAPPVVAAPAPAPAPAPATAAPAPAPAVIAAPAAAAAAKPAPIVAPPPKPAPAPRQDVALAAPSSAAATPTAPVAIETRLIEGIFHCLSPGLPQDWKKAWIEITDAGGGKEKNSRFFFTNQFGDDEGEPLTPCSAQAITRSIVSLDEKLPPERRAWTRARLVIDSEGDYELSYDYPK